MKSQIVFEVDVEGGSIHIERQRSFNKEIFIYHHNEMDASEQSLEVSSNGKYATFEQAFQLIHTRYSWYFSQLSIVHEDYRNYVLEEMIKTFNFLEITPDGLEYSKKVLEKALKVELKIGKIPLRNGMQKIQVKDLFELTEYDYLKFNDNYAIEIGQKFHLRGTYKMWTDYLAFTPKNMEVLTSPGNFQTEGRLEVIGNTIIIRDVLGEIEYTFPSDKYIVTASPLMSDREYWYYKKV